MDREREIRDIAARADETIRAKMTEYLLLRTRFIALTGVDEPNEAFLLDILTIEDSSMQREAAIVARRMRRLARETFPRL